jgi:hypothetical protein
MPVMPSTKAFGRPSNLLSFGIERDTVILHRVGYQRIGAANPLVGGVIHQADTPVPVG